MHCGVIHWETGSLERSSLFQKLILRHPEIDSDHNASRRFHEIVVDFYCTFPFMEDFPCRADITYSLFLPLVPIRMPSVFLSKYLSLEYLTPFPVILLSFLRLPNKTTLFHTSLSHLSSGPSLFSTILLSPSHYYI